MSAKFQNFNEFYPYYLSEHKNLTCRRLHFVGSLLIICVLVFVFITQQWLWLFALPILGYGFAWLGHFFFEHNRPATFTYPFYSFLGDWVMFKDIMFGRLKI
ncbi:Mpo1-like protein [Paraglaciecola sp.]|uniref:Mpo1-like protein n=1 Tax=Paraglaciecola sp. TaxID=1920173 RepID=UPI0030F41253